MSPFHQGLIWSAAAFALLQAGSGAAQTVSSPPPSAPSTSANVVASSSVWNDPADIALVTRTFQAWTDAVIAKDRAKVETFHDEGFRAGSGDKLLTKKQHVDLEMLVGNKEMKLLTITATRRDGDTLIVWSTHFIRVDSIPEIPELGLFGDWGGLKEARKGFEQNEISIWRIEGDHIKCLAFAGSRVSPKK